jgi:hypothetical protein
MAGYGCNFTALNEKMLTGNNTDKTQTIRPWFMEEEIQYIASSDANGKPLNGGKNYKIHLPADIPASNYWSVIAYDNQTQLIISTDQPWPSVFSSSKQLVVNEDGSVDVWFGPKAPVGKENNWIKTIPGKCWNMILRLYYPLESWFDKSWRPGEIVEVR